MKRLLLVCSFFFVAQLAQADIAYVCLHDDKERKINVVYDNPTTKLPCEVVYEKDSETTTLWNAENTEGYCESKAEAFVEKQRGWGWDCTLMAGTEQ